MLEVAEFRYWISRARSAFSVACFCFHFSLDFCEDWASVELEGRYAIFFLGVSLVSSDDHRDGMWIWLGSRILMGFCDTRGGSYGCRCRAPNGCLGGNVWPVLYAWIALEARE